MAIKVEGHIMRKLRIGVVIGSTFADRHVLSFYNWAISRDEIELTVAFLAKPARNILPKEQSNNDGVNHAPGPAMNWTFKAILLAEKCVLSLFSRHKRQLSTFDLGTRGIESICRIPMLTIGENGELGDISRFAPEHLDLDVLVNFSGSAVPASVLSFARLGSLRIDYHQQGATSIDSSGFLESYYRIPKTKFSIMSSTLVNNNEVVVLAGSCRTQFSFILNQFHLHRKSLAQLQNVLLTIYTTGSVPLPRVSAHPHEGVASPKPVQAMLYVAKFVSRISIKAVRHAINQQQKWCIHISHGDWRNANLESAKKISAPRGRFWADPFLYSFNGKTYCFVEDYSYSTGRGTISVLEVSGERVEYLGNALEEKFHLSFPFIFNYGGEVYMCPEASGSKQIRIYKSVSFPLRWELCSIAIDNISAADSMFFEHAGKWWLLTNLDRAGLNDHCSELCLFYANSPLDTHWTPHPKNPIHFDSEGGRNAGLIIDGNKILRAGQNQGFDQYGKGLSLYEIVRLDEEDYEEIKVVDFDRLTPSRSLGSHHISTTGEFTVVDFWTMDIAPWARKERSLSV